MNKKTILALMAGLTIGVLITVLILKEGGAGKEAANQEKIILRHDMNFETKIKGLEAMGTALGYRVFCLGL